MGPGRSAEETAEKQPEKHPKHAKQLFFGCVAARPAVFRLFSRHFAWGPLGTFCGCFQGPAFGASVAGRADRNPCFFGETQGKTPQKKWIFLSRSNPENPWKIRENTQKSKETGCNGEKKTRKSPKKQGRTGFVFLSANLGTCAVRWFAREEESSFFCRWSSLPFPLPKGPLRAVNSLINLVRRRLLN